MQPMLSTEELKEMSTHAVLASLKKDPEAIARAIQPLWSPTGNAADAYLFTAGLVGLITTYVPRPVCSEHGTSGCPPEVLAKVFEGQPPSQVVLAKMLMARYADDDQASVDAWHEAMAGRYAHEVIWLAIHRAAAVWRSGLAALQ